MDWEKQYVKMTFQPKLLDRFNATPIQIQMALFKNVE